MSLLLRQTTTNHKIWQHYKSCNSFYFYIKPQRIRISNSIAFRCNSFYFYIKPQHFDRFDDFNPVVIPSISTSNHNPASILAFCAGVVIPSISTSNHNPFLRNMFEFCVVIPSISTSNHN